MIGQAPARGQYGFVRRSAGWTGRGLLVPALGGALVGVVAFCSVAFAPAVLAPAPCTFLMLAFELEQWIPLEASVPALAILAYGLAALPLAIRQAARPTLSIAVYGAAVVLSVPFFLSAWEHGVQFQGPVYTALVAAENVLCAAALGVLLWTLLRRPSRPRALCFHILLFLWLAWVAFPWFGQMP
jgi:hypothetical protein